MLDKLGKKILMMFFKGVIVLEKNEEVGFEMWKGEVSKNNLKINQNILEYFELDFGFPCKVHEGIIENLRIKIPWKNLNDEIIEIELDNFILIFNVSF
jgi:hypothetical protein